MVDLAVASFGLILFCEKDLWVEKKGQLKNDKDGGMDYGTNFQRESEDIV